ncbi:BTB/POZ and MATH domain-containing protein 1 [Dichanthelium oligosanthes]|uniref:BTB/POZ and MATH domain-containing protein 1 n=1 Tax=Dichanthelium oligosanthes TaxID=888268 RepID=A0A1E5VHX9_9POAL|nr:BTB/POZ and MATH domain-containing protein 1 [Dichanthelium oligosanthes]
MSDSASLEFKLDYLGTKNIAIGEVVCSKNISAGGHAWRIKCYPRGCSIEDEGEYTSIFLQLVSEAKNVKAIFDVFVMERDGAPSSSDGDRCVRVYPPEGYTSWGYPQFVKRSDLESLYVTDGWATIMCVVIVVRDDPLDVPPSDIGSHLGHLLDCPDTSDVSFLIDGEAFPAHRAVLAARSPVFKAQLFGSMADAKMSSITLHDITPATFKVMLRFMYTDAFPADDELGCSQPEIFHDLLAAADCYAVDRLKLLCAKKLWDNVLTDIIGATLACAETYNCPELRKKCIDFFAEEKNFKKAVLTDGFVQLVQKFPSILAELRLKVGA